MRRSTVFLLAVLLGGFGLVFVAGGSALGPLARDAEVSRDLTRLLEARGDLRPGTRARALRRAASADRLATEGRGLVVRLAPSGAVCARPGGLRHLAERAAREALGHYPGEVLAWVEVAFEDLDLRTLLAVGPGQDLAPPAPALPAVAAPGR